MPSRRTRDRFHQLQERLQDPLLTALTIMLAILMFVIAPLQAMGLLAAHYFGIAFAPVLIATVFVVSRSPAAVAAILIAIAMIVVATLFRLRFCDWHRLGARLQRAGARPQSPKMIKSRKQLHQNCSTKMQR
jgi:hypothetical protein